MRKIHSLKTWTVPFWDVVTGGKTFEIRKNDRGFKVGDELELCEFDPDTNSFSGEKYHVVIDYILDLDWIPGFPKGFVGMAISPAVKPITLDIT